MSISSLFTKSDRPRPFAFFFLQSFFSVWAVMRAGSFSVRSILTPVLFLLFALFFRHVSGLSHTDSSLSEKAGFCPALPEGGFPGGSAEYKKRVRTGALPLSFLFTLLTLLAASGVFTAGLDNRLFQLMLLFACAAGLFFLFYYFLYFLLFFAGRLELQRTQEEKDHLPLLCFFLCLLCWLPYFLYEFPGIMTPDSVNQFEQVVGMAPYSNHHPWVHTMLIGLFYRIGSLFTQNRTFALSFFTAFQMCFMAAAVSYLTVALGRLGIKKFVRIIVIAFYALVPYHAVFAVTLWKDVLFSGAVLFFSTALVRILLMREEKSFAEKAFPYTVYALSGVMICLFRSNGFYAFLFSLPFLLFAFRKSLKRMLPLHIGILTAVLIVKGPVMTAYGVTQPDFVESVCIPLQQVARVICDGKELKEEEWELVHRVIDTTYIRKLYAPGFADNMKELVRAGHPEYLETHKGDYLKLWLSLGLRYPASYLQAHIDQTVGYWYPDVAYTVADIDGVIANDTGISSRPLIGGPFVVKMKEILLKLSDVLPLYGLLSSMGAMLWASLFCIAVLFVKKRPERYIVCLPGLAVILTLFAATPVSNEFRYAYSLAFALPLYLLLPFIGEGENARGQADKEKERSF